MHRIVIHTDGGARGNPGPAGIGAVIVGEAGKVLKEVSKFLGTQTNNFAEYQAVIEALEAVKKISGASKLTETNVDVFMDSELVVRQLNGLYQIKEPTLFPQFIRIHNLRVKDFPHVSFSHVPREKNKGADKLANDAMDRGH